MRLWPKLYNRKIFHNTQIELSEHCLKNTKFSFNGKIYTQTDVSSVGFSLSLIIANLFMTIEEETLKNAQLNPILRKRYVVDIFITWFHEKSQLQNFQYLNEMHNTIEFRLDI